MTFDHTMTQAGTETLSPVAAKIIVAAWTRNRAAGLNVQFMREDGVRDEFSFASYARRDEFVAKLVRTGVEHAVSA